MIVATAGHVDHGKTSLVRALTGVDTDRLPEEKKRGLTIDLGFAYLPLAGGGNIGFVDVPGHERFVHNMLAGVAGIDFALLVIAADDGPMPQTREHLAILDLLGVARGVIALAKTDRVAAERVAEVEAQIRSLLAPTALARAQIIPVSVVSGAGLDRLRAALEQAAQALPQRAIEGNFRLSIDRAFTIAGAGQVVTGTALSGEVALGAAVRLLGPNAGARLRSIHVHNASAQRAQAGQRCALNLAGLDARAPIARGDWIVAGDVPPPARRIDVRLRVLASEAAPLAHWTPVHVHLGAANVTGRVALLEAKSLAPGETGLAQLVLDQPIGALYADGFILRDQSARRTLGGGRVIDVFPPARGRARPERIAALAAMEQADPAEALAALLAHSPAGVDLACFAANRNLAPQAFEKLAAQVAMQIAAGRGFAPERWRSLRESALATLAEWHRRAPDATGAPEDRLFEGSGLRLARETRAALADALVREGAVLREGGGLRLAAHRVQLSTEDEALWGKLRPLLEQRELRAPSTSELAAELKYEARRLEAALARLERHGLVARVSKNRFFLPAALERLRAVAREAAGTKGEITAAAFRDRSGIGRNLTIEVLEYFDRIKFTRRRGDAHVLLRETR